MTSIVIAGSSNLLPGAKPWAVLDANHEVSFAEYGDWSGALLNTATNSALVLVLFLNDLFENADDLNIEARLEPFFSVLNQRLKRAGAPTLVAVSSGSRVHPIRAAKGREASSRLLEAFYAQLEHAAQHFSELLLIDLDAAFSVVGTRSVFDLRNWYAARCRLSNTGLGVIADQIERILARTKEPAAKVLILDCDNTLWGGVVGEDGVAGLILGQDGLGQAFVDFQKAVKQLAREGVVLVLASKNNESDVWAVFDEHPGMILSRDDIVAWKINWIDKSANMKALAQELDLGLSSFVFWDDNPVERDKAKNFVPEVLTIDAPDNVLSWPQLLTDLDCFAKFAVTDEDRKKTQQYKSRAAFVRDVGDVEDEIDYLKTINLQAEALALSPATLDRAVQLCTKTNQFNLRTVRHNAADLQSFADIDPDFVFLGRLSDIYGDHGIVGLVALKPVDQETIFVDSFMMSCRVLGRHFEAFMISEACRRAEKHGFSSLVGEFIPSERNIVAQSVYETLGFQPLDACWATPSRSAALGLSTRGERYVFSPCDKPVAHGELYA